MPGKISFSSLRGRPKEAEIPGINQVLGLSLLGGIGAISGVLVGRKTRDGFLLIDDKGALLLAENKFLLGGVD